MNAYVKWSGNLTETNVPLSLVDTIPPTLSIESPANGSFVISADVTVMWEGSDNVGIDRYEIRIDGGEWVNVGKRTSKSYIGLSPGGHTVEVRAYDAEGNSATASVSFTMVPVWMIVMASLIAIATVTLLARKVAKLWAHR